MLKETSRVGYVKTTDYMGHSHNLIGIVMVLAFLLPLSKSTRNRAVCQGINLDSRSPWSGPFSGQGRRFAQSRARGSHLPGRLYRITETRRSSCYQGVDCPLSTARLSWLEGANRQRASACFSPHYADVELAAAALQEILHHSPLLYDQLRTSWHLKSIRQVVPWLTQMSLPGDLHIAQTPQCVLSARTSACAFPRFAL